MERAELSLLETGAGGGMAHGAWVFMWGSETTRSAAGEEEESLPSFRALQMISDDLIQSTRLQQQLGSHTCDLPTC